MGIKRTEMQKASTRTGNVGPTVEPPINAKDGEDAGFLLLKARER